MQFTQFSINLSKEELIEMIYQDYPLKIPNDAIFSLDFNQNLTISWDKDAKSIESNGDPS